MAYTTRSEVEDYLRVSFTSSTTPSDTYVDQMVTEVDLEVDELLNTSYTQQTETEILDLNKDSHRFLVKKSPLISITSVHYNDYTNTNPAFNPNWVEITTTRSLGDYIFIPRTQRVGAKEGQEVKLVYTWGHTSVPTLVKRLATLLVAKRIMSSDDSANADAESISIGPISVQNSISLDRFVNIDKEIAHTISLIGSRKSLLR